MKVVESDFIDSITKTKQITNILADFYLELLEAYKYVSLKTNVNYYTIYSKNIKSVKDITKPKFFNLKSFPNNVLNTIDDCSVSEVVYSFSLFGRNIQIYFIIEERINKDIIDRLNKYIFMITMWFHVANFHSSKLCSPSLIVYIYLTHLEKTLPTNNKLFVLDTINVNTAFTTSCPLKPNISEIVIFRSEEWFKVLIHETFHNFGLDFSDMNNNDTTNFILNIYGVKSDVNLYESYTEFWAEIIHSLFCAFLFLNNPLKNNEINTFLSLSYFFINIERKYSFIQMTKTLNFMGLDYIDLYSDKLDSVHLRETNYKEATNVLSYYIIKSKTNFLIQVVCRYYLPLLDVILALPMCLHH
jgi:hypothetical protein